MSAQDHLNPYQFFVHIDADDHNIATAAAVEKHRLEENDPVGYMHYSRKGGTIEELNVHPDHQGKGIATELWRTAQRAHAEEPHSMPKPRHSRARTDAGEAWAKKVGGYRPPRSRGYDSRVDPEYGW